MAARAQATGTATEAATEAPAGAGTEAGAMIEDRRATDGAKEDAAEPPTEGPTERTAGEVTRRPISRANRTKLRVPPFDSPIRIHVCIPITPPFATCSYKKQLRSQIQVPLEDPKKLKIPIEVRPKCDVLKTHKKYERHKPLGGRPRGLHSVGNFKSLALHRNVQLSIGLGFRPQAWMPTLALTPRSRWRSCRGAHGHRGCTGSGTYRRS